MGFGLIKVVNKKMEFMPPRRQVRRAEGLSRIEDWIHRNETNKRNIEEFILRHSDVHEESISTRTGVFSFMQAIDSVALLLTAFQKR